MENNPNIKSSTSRERRIRGALIGGATIGTIGSIVAPGTVATFRGPGWVRPNVAPDVEINQRRQIPDSAHPKAKQIMARRNRQWAAKNPTAGKVPRQIALKGGVAGVLAGLGIGAALAGNKKLELARGLIHSYLIELGIDPADTDSDVSGNDPATTALSALYPNATFFRTRDLDPFGGLHSDPIAQAQAAYAGLKKTAAGAKKTIRQIRTGAEVAGDIYDATHKRGAVGGISRALAKVDGKQSAGGKWRVSQETGSSVRIHHKGSSRQRRKKYAWEKKANRDKVAGAAIAGALGTGYAAHKLVEHTKQRVRNNLQNPGHQVTTKEIGEELLKKPARVRAAYRLKSERKRVRKEFPNPQLDPANRVAIDPSRGRNSPTAPARLEGEAQTRSKTQLAKSITEANERIKKLTPNESTASIGGQRHPSIDPLGRKDRYAAQASARAHGYIGEKGKRSLGKQGARPEKNFTKAASYERALKSHLHGLVQANVNDGSTLQPRQPNRPKGPTVRGGRKILQFVLKKGK